MRGTDLGSITSRTCLSGRLDRSMGGVGAVFKTWCKGRLLKAARLSVRKPRHVSFKKNHDYDHTWNALISQRTNRKTNTNLPEHIS